MISCCLYMVCAFVCVVSISVVRIVCPYSLVRDVFRVSRMMLASSWVRALELATRYMFRLYFVCLLFRLVWCVVGLQIFGRILCGGCELGTVCASMRGVLVGLSFVGCLCDDERCRWLVLVLL